VTGEEYPAYRDTFEHLADELSRLDLLIRVRLATADLQNEAVPQAQTARTVYITRQEVDWLLAGGQDGVAPGAEPGAGPGDEVAELQRLSVEIDGRVRRSLAEGVWLGLPVLGRLFGLSTLEHLAVVVCLAPELRRRYDRLYAYLQDDITRRRPSVDLILDLLCPSERQRWAARGAFAATGPLLRAGLLRAVDDPHSPSGSSDLARFLALDPRVCQFLLGADDLDARLVGRVRVRHPQDAAPTDPALAEGMLRLAGHHLATGPNRRALVFHLRGPAGAGKRELARLTSHRLGVPLLSLDVAVLTGLGAEAEELLRLTLREGLLRQAAVHLAGVDPLLREETPVPVAALAGAVADFGWLVFLTGEAEWAAERQFAGAVFQPVAVPMPDRSRAIDLWRQELAGHTADPDAWAADLAARFHLPPARIRAAVQLAENGRRMRPHPGAMTLADVSAACRQRSNSGLDGLAVPVRPRYGWHDLVLPEDRLAQLREICGQVRHHHRVFAGWGFQAKIGHGRGVSALFSGPPGTGKTMAAEVLAGDLDLDLYKVDLSGVVSKYIGETEKNLARVFAEARSGNAILFFDEADALFGKRTEVSDAHDRYANVETSYLLQKMEEFEGVVVLATNLRQNMDEAFVRRLRFIVEFPFPEAGSRRLIWQSLVPPEAPLSSDVDFAALARDFPVAGGSIRNIVLHAAFLAAADGGVINRRHILRGTRREFQKIGKLWSEPPLPGDPVPAGREERR
jgi:AAA+ superfamily predicted ATPase